MRPRSLAVLALLLVGLLAFVWFYERELPSSEEREAAAKKVLGGLEADEVRAIAIERGGETVRLVREGGGETGEDAAQPAGAGAPAGEWRLAGPLQARADRFAVEGLLASLAGLEKARTLEAVEREAYGLAPPQARVTLTTDEGERTLEVGREVPGTDQRVVALAGEERVFAVAEGFWDELDRAPGEWRSRQLFPGQQHEVARVALRGQGRTVRLARRGDAFWIEAPVDDRADRERVDELLAAIASLEAADFVDAPPPSAELGLDPARGVVEVVREGREEPFRIALGAPRGEGGETRYARAGGQLVTVAAPALATALARPPEEWRSREWTPWAVYQVQRVEVKAPEGPLTLTRADADWKRGEETIFYGPVSDLLAAVADARAERLLTPAEAEAQGLTAGAPALTLELADQDDDRQTLTLWPARGGIAAARSSGREVVLLLPASTAQELASRVEAVRRAEPLAAEEPAEASAEVQ